MNKARYHRFTLLVGALALVACDQAAIRAQVLAQLSVNPTSVPADGKTTATGRVVLTHQDGKPVEGVPVALHSSRNQSSEVDTILTSAYQTDADGVWTCTISSKTAGTTTLSAFTDEQPLCAEPSKDCTAVQVELVFTGGPPPPPPPPPTELCVPVADGTAVQLTKGTNHSHYPSIAVDKSNFLVAYDQAVPDGAPFFGKRSAFVARYDAAGVAQGGAIPISPSSSEGERPVVITTSSGFAVVYTGRDGGASSVMFALLKSDGSLDGSPKTLAKGEEPAIAAAGGKFGVVFTGRPSTTDKSTTWFLAVDQTGSASGAPVKVATDDSGDSPTFPQIASDGSSFVTVWQDRRKGPYGLFLRKVGSDGKPAGNELTLRAESKSVSVAAQIVWTGTEYGVVFSDTRHEYGHYQIYLARIAADGSQVVTETQITSAKENADTPGLTFWKGRYWISWVEKAWGGDAQPFALSASSPAIDTGADVGLPYTGAAPDIGAIEFGAPWPPTTSTTTLWLASFEAASGKTSDKLLVAGNQGFSAFPKMQGLGEKLVAVWFDVRNDKRDLFGLSVRCK